MEEKGLLFINVGMKCATYSGVPRDYQLFPIPLFPSLRIHSTCITELSWYERTRKLVRQIFLFILDRTCNVLQMSHNETNNYLFHYISIRCYYKLHRKKMATPKKKKRKEKKKKGQKRKKEECIEQLLAAYRLYRRF